MQRKQHHAFDAYHLVSAQFPGQVREHYTVKEADAFGETIVKKLPLSLLHLMLPFAVEVRRPSAHLDDPCANVPCPGLQAFPAGKVDDMVNHKLPPPLRILLRKKARECHHPYRVLQYLKRVKCSGSTSTCAGRCVARDAAIVTVFTHVLSAGPPVLGAGQGHQPAHAGATAWLLVLRP